MHSQRLQDPVVELAIDRVLAGTELRQAQSKKAVTTGWSRWSGGCSYNDYLGHFFLWAVQKNKGTDSCIGARASKGLHSLMTAIPVAATAPASPFARPLPRRVPATPSMRTKHEKEKTNCSTRFPNGRLETTCSSSTRYAHIRLARTRKSLRLSTQHGRRSAGAVRVPGRLPCRWILKR